MNESEGGCDRFSGTKVGRLCIDRTYRSGGARELFFSCVVCTGGGKWVQKMNGGFGGTDLDFCVN